MASFHLFVSTAALLVTLIVLLPSLEAIRSPHHLELRSSEQQQQLQLPQFREAPAFRNGEECASRRRSIISGRKLASAHDEEQQVCYHDDDGRVVHVAMTLDAAYLRGSMAAIMSIVQHASCPEDVVFHFLVSSDDPASKLLKATVKQAFPYLRYRVYPFHSWLVRHRISSSVRSDLEQPLNYARNYLDTILDACVHRVIYLDSDLVLVDDIAKLWNTELQDGRAVGAPEYCHANFTKYFTATFWSNATMAGTFASRPRRPCYFNTGVMVIDLDKWRLRGYTAMLETWMDVQKERKIYELGSLPPFLLVFAGDVEPIEHRWNQHGLGGDYVVGSCRDLHPGPVSLLHWSGKGKPWARLDSATPCPLDSLWAPYDLAITGRKQLFLQQLLLPSSS